ncbi:hypothetical protein CEF00_13070, partial [Lactobacillus crispatus]
LGEIEPFVRPDDAADIPTTSAGHPLAGSPSEIADRIEAAAAAVGLDGFLVAPPVLRNRLDAFSAHVVPELARRQRLRPGDGAATLRERFGLARPRNVFETAASQPTSTAA